MKPTFSNSPDGDIPIPPAPRGSMCNIDRISFSYLYFPWVNPYDYPATQTSRTVLGIFVSCLLILTPYILIAPQYAWAIESHLAFEQNQTTEPVVLPDHWNPVLQDILRNEVSRHNVSQGEWVHNIDQFIQMVSHIESDNKQMAYNPSGAMSYFQFKDTSIQTAHNRLINYVRRHDLGAIPRWSTGLYYHPENIYYVPQNQQAVLMIINIIEQDRERETDYFAQFLHGDLDAGVTAYYKYHHTNPDQFTINRTERLFAHYFTNQ